MQLNPIEKAEMLLALERAIEVTDPPHVDNLRKAFNTISALLTPRSCRLCMDLGHGDYCTVWKQAVPPEWIDVGCDKWIDDDIPF